MIGPLDTFILARTKLRSKRVLLIVTIIISGLLFGILIAGFIIVTGASQSATKFFEATQHGQYLVSVQPYIPSSAYPLSSFDKPSKETVDELLDLEKDYIAKQKELFRQQKLPFDPATVPSILTANPFNQRDDNGVIFKTINQKSPVYPAYVKHALQTYTKTAPNTVEKITERGKRHGVTAIYPLTRPSGSGGTLTFLPDGQEHLDKKPTSNNASNKDPRSTNIQQATYARTDQAIMSRFIFPTNSARTAHSDAIPVVLNTTEIVDVFGKQLGISAKPTDPTKQADWYKSIYQKANGLTYTYCYRSQGERELIQRTMQTNTDIAEAKNDPTYQAPALQYNLPTETCGPLTVKKDTRSAEQKSIDAKQETIQKELGTYQPIEHKILTFQIVGAFNLTDFMDMNSISAYVSLLLGATYQEGAFIPQQLYDALPADPLRDTILFNTTSSPDDTTNLLAEAHIRPLILSFPTIDAARAFIKQESCTAANGDIRSCTAGIFADPYGSNYLAVEDFGAFIRTILPYALGTVMSIAAIIIWVTMARVMIDSRRETAVFRALGAKRRDIASVYLTYSLMVASLIALFSFGLGLALALLADRAISAPATAIAQVSYGTFDTTAPTFHVVGFDILLIALALGSIIGISLLAVILPLMRNVRRSPIRDMRDE